MMDHIYIKKREPENDLYPKLLRQSIERLQQMSGELWTDYNTNDDRSVKLCFDGAGLSFAV